MKTNSKKKGKDNVIYILGRGRDMLQKENEGKELYYTGGKFYGSGYYFRNNQLTSFFPKLVREANMGT